MIMEPQIRAQLELIVVKGSDFYRQTAQSLLAGELQWSRFEIEQFLDGFMNDPYLTRNQ